MKYINVSDPVIYDHSAVHCGLFIKKPDFEKLEITYRKLWSIDRECFIRDIRKSELANYNKFENVSALVDCYDSTLSGLLEQRTRLLRNVLLLYDSLRRGITIRSERKKQKEGDWRGYGVKTNLRLIGKCSLSNANVLKG